MNTKTIRQSIKIRATPAEVYEMLMDSKKHTRFTGQKANITKKVGGSVSCYDGYITATNLELKPAGLIVQAWRSRGWPKGHYSIVTFRLSKAGKNTRLDFTQIGVPAGDFRAKTQGWKTHYWTPLKSALERK